MQYKKQYGLFYQSRQGTIHGFVERSFSMGWIPGEVRLWDVKNAQAYLEDFRKGYPDIPFFVLRITRKNLPHNIVINWHKSTHKSNVRFSIKDEPQGEDNGC